MSAAKPVALFRLAFLAALMLGAAACSGEPPAEQPAGSAPPGAPAGGIAAPPEIEAAPTRPEGDAAPAAPSEHMPAVGLSADGHPHTWASAAQIGGSMFALAEACDHPSVEDPAAARAEQRRASESLGVDPDDFMAVLDWAHAQASRKLDAASDEQREESCRELRGLEAMVTPDPA
ncbi:hypothetical protein QFW77_06235 [Luteimonas sp. RD2P54]|uniref:Uncharacterized protein n=1 Tax=Luteimonas endophytica TaxID=3042023 RepID=A0ABT6J770_9GAMM|nr:hypothetical protein [Luteimonas endophytica]MDH5822589.1 hypothetical protein [Luteimonas endophytica]